MFNQFYQFLFKILKQLWIVLCLIGTNSFAQKHFELEAQDTQVLDEVGFTNMLQFFKEVKSYQDKTGEFDYDAKLYLSYASSGLSWAESKGTEWNVLEAKFYKLRYSYDVGLYPQSILLANDLLASDQFQQDKRISRVTSYVKRIYLNTQEYGKLLQFYPIYDSMNRKHGRIVSKSDYINDQYLAMAYYSQKNYTKAIAYLKKRAIIVEKAEGGFAPSTYNDIGLCFKNINEWDSALFYFNLSLAQQADLKKEGNAKYDEFLELIVQSNRADYWVYKGQQNKAMPIYEKELKISKAEKSSHILPSAYYNVANVHYLNNDISASLAHIDSAIYTAKEGTDFLAKCFLLKAKCLAALGKRTVADRFFTKADALRDSLELNRVKKSYIMQSTQYDLARKESDLDASRAKVESEKVKNLYQFAGLILLGVLALILFIFFRKAIKDKTLIKKQELEAKASVHEKEILLKEIHHRVKNNLQVISSLLELQIGKLKNKEYSQVVEETQRHIHSMSLVHQMLYQTEDISKINLNEYLKKLSTFIHSGQLKQDVEINIDTADVEIALEKAIPLGLIVTELITNSFKHAFVDNEQGSIDIKVSEEESKKTLNYTDNGNGIPAAVNIETSRSLGFRLIRMLSEEMKANLQVSGKAPFQLTLNFIDEQ